MPGGLGPVSSGKEDVWSGPEHGLLQLAVSGSNPDSVSNGPRTAITKASLSFLAKLP